MVEGSDYQLTTNRERGAEMDAFILEISTWQCLILLLPLRWLCHLDMRNEVTGSAPVVPHVSGLFTGYFI